MAIFTLSSTVGIPQITHKKPSRFKIDGKVQKEKDIKNTVKFAQAQTAGEPQVAWAPSTFRKWFAGDVTSLKVAIEAQ